MLKNNQEMRSGSGGIPTNPAENHQQLNDDDDDDGSEH